MSETLKIIYEGGKGEIIEKKSRFIAYTKPVHTENEAMEFIESIKKMNWDARHNCVAVAIGKNNEFTRCNDDGEPSGTAGKPMLEVLLGEGIHNIAVVVTRYFGGVLLGTGGLVRAYQAAVKEGIANSVIIQQIAGARFEIKTDYNGLGKIQYISANLNLFIEETEYGEDVKITIMVPKDKIDSFIKKVTDATNAKAEIVKTMDVDYGIVDGEVKIL